MSYIVMARKWRPSLFEDVVSQDHVTATLKNAIASERIAHSYLFSGPRGVGKTTTARILAKAVNCASGPTPTPCDECTSCKEIRDGRNLDVLEIDGASNRGIDEIRELRETVGYVPMQGKYKVYIIDEVHMLTPEAFNALLKTLEEPPPRIMFIFATTEPHKVPATILSRCQRFDFKRIPTEDIVEKLRSIAQSEGINTDDDVLFLIARKADGALRDAQSLFDQIISFAGKDVSFESTRDILGLIDRDLLFHLTDAISSKDASQGLGLVSAALESGANIGELLTDLIEHLRNLLFAKIEGGMRSIEGTESEKERYQEASRDFSEEDLLRMIKILSDLELTISRSSQPRFRLEMAIVKLVHLESTVLLKDLLERLSNLESRLVSDGLPQSAEPTSVSPQGDFFESAPPKAQGQQEITAQEENPEEPKGDVEREPIETTLENLQDNWGKVLDRVKKKSISLGTFLSTDGRPESISDGVLTLCFQSDNAFCATQVKRNKKTLEAVLSEIFTHNPKVHCVIVENQEAEGKEEADKDNVALQDVMEIFDGELMSYDQ